MIRTATELDLAAIYALINSVPGLWHKEWRSDSLERALLYHRWSELMPLGIHAK